MELELPESVRAVAQGLAGRGIAVYLVGGALRDLLLGRAPRDFDFVVDVPLEQAALALPRARRIDAHTPVLLLPEREGEARVEIAAFRSGASTLAEDLGLRDFTLNAIAAALPGGELVDPLGGRRDLEKGRLVACDAARAFRDDPLRVLRGVRLAHEFTLVTEEKTRRELARDAWRLAGTPGERVRDELFRLLALPAPDRALASLRTCGALAAVLPELLRGVGVAQSRHHSDDVYRHTLAVCAALPPKPELRLAALLHDVAKPETKGFLGRGGDVSFHRHEHRAAPWIATVAARLRLSRRQTDYLGRLVRHHLLFEDRLATDAALRRMVRRVGRDILPDLLELRRADLASRGSVPESWRACEARIRAELERQTHAAPALAIAGEDVMRALGVASGPEVGRWLGRAERYVEKHPERNERQTLISWLEGEAARREREE